MRDMRSKLNKYYADDFIRKAVQYFDSLSPDAQKRISVFRLSQHLECNSFKAAAFLNRCAENGIVRKYRVLCCLIVVMYLRKFRLLEIIEKRNTVHDAIRAFIGMILIAFMTLNCGMS